MTHAIPTPEEQLGLLCRACGLCCDGALFGRVTLEEDEAPGAKRLRLHVLPSGRAFEQPCAALAAVGEGSALRTCTIYEDRPRACERFVCRLYERHRTDGGALEPRLATVQRARELLASLEASGLTASDFEGERLEMRALGASGDRYEREYAELVVLMRDFERADSSG